ncbi:MAG: acetate/propionate family kinase, partial [Roseimicrobium sp.]
MQNVLTINGGSSSIRFAMHEVSARMKPTLQGKLDHLGLPSMTLSLNDAPPTAVDSKRPASAFLLDWLTARGAFEKLAAVGHRIVHGMHHTEPVLVTDALLSELRTITGCDPEHLPLEIELIETIRQRYPALPQVTCFDTAFHRTMPRVAKMLPIPRRYEAQGIQRYGFHGLSYAYLLEELHRLDPAAAQGRVILAHLGSGASVAAVLDGQCIDTSMGFTPAGGVMMSTRSGDVDPGLLSYLTQTEALNASQLQQMLTHESGLLGVSATSADMRQLLATEATDERAAEAVAMFCYQIKK